MWPSATVAATLPDRSITGRCARARSSTSEPPDTNVGEARRWLRQSRDELNAAERLVADPELAPRIACFLAHLAAEKALKACVIARGEPLRRVHDLLVLHDRLPDALGAGFCIEGLSVLNTWLMEGRYPGDLDDATPAEATECLAAAAGVIDEATRVVELIGG